MRLGPKIIVRSNSLELLSSKLRTYPLTFRAFAALRETHKNRMVTRSTEIVIEGLPRCGNHFATYAFEEAQGRPVDIAHHFHAAAQLILGVRWAIPCLLLIREPEEQALSFMVHRPWLSPDTALYSYTRFMDAVRHLRKCLVVADFTEVTTDMGGVIARVNAFYGTSFVPFVHTAANEKRIFERIDHEFRTHMSGYAGRYPAPSVEKERLKEVRRRQLRDPQIAVRLAEARHSYEMMLSDIDVTLTELHSSEVTVRG